jgi:glycosyltransferase involved in cell wall biosynthesis
MNPSVPLSVAIITMNAAGKLPACLRSVAFAEQIVVVDSGSSDDTVSLAASFGCDVIIEAWHGFGPQKQIAVDRCRNDWVLVLDADERIPSETAEVIKKIVRQPQPYVSYSFPRKNYFQGRWIRHAGWWPDRVIRLFRKDQGRMTPALVHEAVEVDNPVVALAVPVEHDTESRLSELLRKIDRYSTLGAQEAFAAGRRSTVWGAALRAALAFFHGYIIRLGFLDGPQGFTLAVADSVNKYFKYAKLSELSGKAKDRGVDKGTS